MRQPHEEGHVLVGHPDADLTWSEAGDSLEAELFARALRSSVSKGEPAKGVALSANGHGTRVRSLRRGLVLADACGFAVAFAAVQAFVSNFQPGDLRISAIVVAGLVMWLGLTQAYGLYDRDEIGVARSAVDDLPGSWRCPSIATLAGLFLVNGAGLAHPKLQVAAAFWLLSIAFVTLARALARSLVKQVLAPTEPTLDRRYRDRRAASRGEAHVASRVRARGRRVHRRRPARAARRTARRTSGSSVGWSRSCERTESSG